MLLLIGKGTWQAQHGSLVFTDGVENGDTALQTLS